MKFIFKKEIDNFLKIIVNCAKMQNINVYFAGGIVRDNILNHPISDIDLIIDNDVLEFVNYLPDKISIKSLHKDFHTAKIQYQNINIDIASTREEHYPYSGCLPVVDNVGVDIKKDYIRRDFTVNSMYAKIDIKNNNLEYELIDFANGLNDIKNKILRVLHNKSYIDDPTRILRGVDFKYRFDFDFSDDDIKLINTYLDNINVQNASTDRILSVFRHIFSKEHSDKIFNDITKNNYYKIINNSDLTFDYGLIKKTIEQFKIENKADFYLKILKNEQIELLNFKNIYEAFIFFKKQDINDLAYYFYKTKDDFILKYLSNVDFKILTNGRDLINSGYKQGKQIGEILSSLFIAKFNDTKIKTKEDEINFIKRSFPQK